MGLSDQSAGASASGQKTLRAGPSRIKKIQAYKHKIDVCHSTCNSDPVEWSLFHGLLLANTVRLPQDRCKPERVISLVAAVSKSISRGQGSFTEISMSRNQAQRHAYRYRLSGKQETLRIASTVSDPAARLKYKNRPREPIARK